MRQLTSFRASLLASCLAIGTLGLPALGQSELRASVEADYSENLAELFRHFHANPELSFLEHETAARLAEEIRALGYDVTEGVGETGIVAVLENGDGPTVMIRADMDGLPVKEQSGLDYASTATQVDITGEEQPVMHACGHDVHMTALVGTAKQLMERREDWSGTLVLIGQPAEERIGGAKKMLEDGLYERFPKPDYALALHVAAQLEEGLIKIAPGSVYSSSDSVDIIVHGVGTHGAAPHRGIDPVLTASQIVVALQSVVARNVDPLQPAVITVGAIHGGTKHNIISDRVEMQLTVRSNDAEVRETLLAGIDRVAENVGRAMGLPEELLPEVIPTGESTPVTVNHPETTALVRAAFLEHLGEKALTDVPREGMGAEDFAYFVQPELGVKGVYFAVGGTPADEVETAPSHHSPLFKINPEPSVIRGVEAMTVAAMALFEAPSE